MDCNDIVVGSFDDWFTHTYMHEFKWVGEPHHDTRLDCKKSEWDNTPSFGQSSHHDL